uniref:Elongation factor Ts, mitochondrial n=1 Tax=Olisthodiscus luteus TaxID=83000 RepID=A0A7U0KT31_OLILU|nr:translation elongation factor Ts [Olisthodiscus luteus]QQW50520.1 translation elongation factor Ts [Olisthodiscus luteus]
MGNIDATLVKKLREETGAGMMNCKTALVETDGDFEKAIETLRKQGLSTADKKSERTAKEGLIEAYIHTGSKIGVLIEVNCETDFVARSDEFQELTKNLAMQVAACPGVKYVNYSDIPESVVEKEKEIESGKEDLKNKPDDIREKMVSGRVEKLLSEQVLLDQNFIKDSNLKIGDLITQKVALLGENIKIARFSRFVLGSQ